MFNRFDSSRTTRGAAAAAGRLLHRHDRQVAPRQRSRRLRPLGDPAGPGRLRRSGLLHGRRARRPTPGEYVTDVITDLAHRLPREAAAEQAVLPDGASQGAASAVGAGRGTRARSSPTGGSRSRSRSGTPTTRARTRCTKTSSASRTTSRDRDLKLQPPPASPDAELDDAGWRRSRRRSRSHGDGKTVTLTGEALARWKYQRYMQDYLATVQSVDDNVGRLLDFLDRQRPREEHHRHLHERPGLLPRRPRPVRQALHVRGVAADAVPRALAGGDQAGHAERRAWR